MKTKLHIQLISCAWLTASATMLTACGNNDTTLTESGVKSAVNELIAPYSKHFTPASLEIGFYELNSESDRTNLRKLAAAGMITYDAQIVIEKIQRYYYSREKEHVFVTVSLTPEGQKLVMSEEEVLAFEKAVLEASKGSAKDLECPNIDTEYPENNIGPEIITNIVRDEGTGSQDSYTPNSQESQNDGTSGATNTQKEKKSPETVYEKALERVSTETVHVRAYKMRISKIRNILCPPAMAETGKGTAEIITEYTDVTPFGRILTNALEGEKNADKMNFTYFNDKGWTIDND